MSFCLFIFVLLIVFLNCKSLCIKASAELINVNASRRVASGMLLKRATSGLNTGTDCHDQLQWPFQSLNAPKTRAAVMCREILKGRGSNVKKAQY